MKVRKLGIINQKQVDESICYKMPAGRAESRAAYVIHHSLHTE
jgi:hypothetical protein